MLNAGRDHLPTTNAAITLSKCNDYFIPALLPEILQDQKDHACSAERSKSYSFQKQQNAKGEGMSQGNKQTFADFPKHAEMQELILAGEMELRTELGMSSVAGGSRFLILPLCTNRLYHLHQIFPFFILQFIHLQLRPLGSTVRLVNLLTT